MTRRDSKISFDTEGLQADVMRFMAIIAFCLIAILALVQKLEPQEPLVAHREKHQAAPVAQQKQKPSTIKSQKPASEPTAAKIMVTPEKVPTASTTNAAAALLVTPRVTPLILRFASEKVFLSLIANSEITLIVQYQDSFLQLDAGFGLRSVNPTGQLYELLPESLPGKILKVVNRKQAASNYLVQLPEAMVWQIDRLETKHRQSGGELIVQPNGEVIHEA